MTVTGSLPLTQLPEMELVEGLRAGAVDPMAFGAEVKRRVRADKARAAARRRNAEWEAAAYAQYLEADAYARGNLLSAAGQRAGRDAWPMCWEGSDETARRLASDELITFWDYVSPRVPGPGAYAAAKRAAAAEQATRASRPTVPPMSQAQIARYTAALSVYGSRAASLTPAPQPGSIARYTARLEALTDQLTRQAARLAQVNGGNQR